MHALLLTVVALGGGANVHISDRAPQPSVTKAQVIAHTTRTAVHTSNGAVRAKSVAVVTKTGGGCSSCESGDGCNGCSDCKSGLFGRKNRVPAGFGRGMPQTCYAPRYGCYHSNNRYMARYPAFHGHFYRRPYNYRNTFDYPWHAEMHEPTSMFSYNVTSEVVENEGAPAPPPEPAQARVPRSGAGRAHVSDAPVGTGVSTTQSDSSRRIYARPISH